MAILHVTEVEVTGAERHELAVSFDDGTRRCVELGPLLKGCFEPLRDVRVRAQRGDLAAQLKAINGRPHVQIATFHGGVRKAQRKREGPAGAAPASPAFSQGGRGNRY